LVDVIRAVKVASGRRRRGWVHRGRRLAAFGGCRAGSIVDKRPRLNPAGGGGGSGRFRRRPCVVRLLVGTLISRIPAAPFLQCAGGPAVAAFATHLFCPCRAQAMARVMFLKGCEHETTVVPSRTQGPTTISGHGYAFWPARHPPATCNFARAAAATLPSLSSGGPQQTNTLIPGGGGGGINKNRPSSGRPSLPGSDRLDPPASATTVVIHAPCCTLRAGIGKTTGRRPYRQSSGHAPSAPRRRPGPAYAPGEPPCPRRRCHLASDLAGPPFFFDQLPSSAR